MKKTKYSPPFQSSWKPLLTSCVALIVLLANAGASLAAPVLLSTGTIDGKTVALRFANALDPVSAANAANYNISGATIQGATLLADNQTVLLTVQGFSGNSYSVSASNLLDAQGNPGNVSGNGTNLNLTVTDIGSLKSPSVVYSYTNSSISVKVDGGSIWDTNDAGNFIYASKSGNFDVAVQVASVSGGDMNSNMALDVRESTDPGSRHVTCTAYPTQARYASFKRDAYNGATTVFPGSWAQYYSGTFPNVWLRIRYYAGTFTMYGSLNGIDWTQVGDALTPGTAYTNTIVCLGSAVTDNIQSPLLVEYQKFGEYTVSGTVQITSQPSATNVIEYTPASFSVGANLLGNAQSLLTYQWQRNGVDILGATAATYTFVPALTNNGDVFRVVVGAPGVTSVTSSPAVLTVTHDTEVPVMNWTAGLLNNNITVNFSKVMDPISAVDPSQYVVNGGAIPVVSAIMLNSQTVILRTPSLSGAFYTLQANAVKSTTGNSVNASLTGQITPLTLTDIGTMASPSEAYAWTNSAVNLLTKGGAIWNTPDSGSYVYQTRTGDFDVKTRINSVSGGGWNANIILDVRESQAVDTRHFCCTVYPTQGKWVGFQRSSTGGNASVLPGSWSVSFPAGMTYPNIWMRVRYQSGSFTVFGGTNGLDWVQVGNSVTPSTPYASTLVGVVGALTATTYSPMSVQFSQFGDTYPTNGQILITTQPSNQTAVEYSPATFSVRASLTNGPQSELAYQWQCNGADIPGATGSNYTFYPSLSDNGKAYRVVVSAGLIAPAVTSAPATLTVVPETQPARVQWTAGMLSSITINFNKLMDPVTATDASRYIVNGGGVSVSSATLLTNNQTVILQVSGVTGSSYTLNINGVQNMAGVADTETTTGNVLPFDSIDIFGMNAPSVVYVSSTNGSVDVTIDGGNIWGQFDSGNFVSQPKNGDFDVKVQITKILGGGRDANVLLDVRESNDQFSRHIGCTVYPDQGKWVAFQRADYMGASTLLPGVWGVFFPNGATYPNVWMRVQYRNGTFTFFGGTNGLDWVQVGNSVTPSTPYSGTVVGILSGETQIYPPMEFEFANFGDTIPDGWIEITQQPASTNVIENTTAAFSVGANLHGGSQSMLTYQWQKNGVNIPGATNTTYTFTPTYADNGTQFKAIVAAGLLVQNSSTATLTVNHESQPPLILWTAGLQSNNISIKFDKLMDGATVSNATFYSVNSGAAAISSVALLADQETVVLQVPGLTGSSYTLQVSGVKSAAGNTIVTTNVTGNVSSFRANDLGTLTPPSRVYTSTNGIQVEVTGGVMWNSTDTASFVGEPKSGDFDVKVQVKKVTGGGWDSMMILDARESIGQTSRHVACGVYPSQGKWVAFYRDVTGGNTYVAPGTWAVAFPSGSAYPNIWMRIKYTGGTFTVYGGTNGVDWVQVGNPITPSVPYASTVVGVASVTTGGPVMDVEYGNPIDSTRPQLRIFASGENIVLAWPASVTGYHLLQTTQLGAGAVWTTVNNTPVVSGVEQQVSLPKTASTTFYRLSN